MSDEEKKAVDLLKNIDKQKCVMLECPAVKNNIERQLKIIELNRLIRKQSKEIEGLKKYKEGYKLLSYSLDNYTSKDKIKAKIEEYEKEIQIRKNVINNDVLDKQTIEKARIEWACMEDFIYEMQSLLEKE